MQKGASMATKLEDFIKKSRVRPSGSPKASLELEVGSDRGRIIFSAPFRRLQKKAQVFPLEGNAAVRSRLTHSLEVAHLGMYIVECICSSSKDDKRFDDFNKNQMTIETLVENACLMHDFGNPPFGHFGEKAIRDWFEKNYFDFASLLFKPECEKDKCLGDSCDKLGSCATFRKTFYQDFLLFDGNPQGLRIVTRLQGEDGETGLNLTYSQLGSFLKYVLPAHKVAAEDAAAKNQKNRQEKGEQETAKRLYRDKPGFFKTEESLVNNMWQELKITPETRHPLVYIMEAADDLAYCISDIEDGVEKQIISWDLFLKGMGRIWKSPMKYMKDTRHVVKAKGLFREMVEEAKKRKTTVSLLIGFKTELNNRLVKFAAIQFIKDFDQIIAGKAKPLFDKKASPEALLLDALAAYTKHNLFIDPAAENMELAGYEIIKGLLTHFKPLLECSRKDFEEISRYEYKVSFGKTDLHRRLRRRLSESSFRAYQAASKDCKDDQEEWFYRAHMIVDYISGMTDQFALEEFQMLSGIKVQ
jgi:dGTPase